MKSISVLLFVFVSFLGMSQKIKIKVTGEKDTTVFLVKYYGKGMYYADTAEMKKGVVEFKGSKQKPGVLALLLPGQKYFDFIYNNADVNIETSGPDFIKTMVVKNSIENSLFLNYIRFMNEKRTRAKELGDQREKLKKEEPEYKSITKELEGIAKEVVAYQKILVAENPTTLVSKIVKMSMDVEVPEAPRNVDGSLVDSNFAYHYFRDHYFDNIDLNDDRLLSTPVFHNKLEYFFSNNMLPPMPDSIVKFAYRFCDNLNIKSEMFKYCVTHITSNYEKSNIMGMDKVFVRMGQRYYCVKNYTGKLKGSTNITWMDSSKLEDLCKKVEINKNLVQGVVPPNISLVDTTDTKWRDFYSLKSEYTILYFWDPECGHCKKTTPKLGELYVKKLKDRNVEVFAVGKAVGEDYEKWKKFIRDNKLTFINVALTDKLYKAALEDARQFVPKYTSVEALNYQETYDIYSTPKIFVLDKDKKIIAKGLSISQLEDMLDHYQNKKDAPKLFPPDPEEEEHAKEH
jgi:thiol-disulfide isomerase/thioredoxin